MTLKELKKDISSLLVHMGGSEYKFKPLFKKDNNRIMRRSFNDLFYYYKRKGVTEKLLMKALIDMKFVARYCNGPKRIVFFKYRYPVEKFWWTAYHRNQAFKNTGNCGKYTAEYLEELYNKVIK